MKQLINTTSGGWGLTGGEPTAIVSKSELFMHLFSIGNYVFELYVIIVKDPTSSCILPFLISNGGRAVFDLYVDLPPREKLILLIGDTASLIDSEVSAIFDRTGKDMLCQFWSKRQTIRQLLPMHINTTGSHSLVRL